MKEIITNKLKEIESKRNIKILYACETGSRAWGFPSPDSDYDVRIIYMHEVDWYLSLSEKKDTLEMMLDNGELDITGWDIRKCLRLLWKSNGALLERIQSPIVYHEIDNISTILREYANSCFAPIAGMHHYLGMAKNSFHEVNGQAEVKLKRLFYSLRAALACKWIVEKDSIPPIVFTTMVNELTFDQKLKERIIALIALKSTKVEGYIHPAEFELNDFISNELSIAEKVFNTLGGRRGKKVDLDELFLRIIKSYQA